MATRKLPQGARQKIDAYLAKFPNIKGKARASAYKKLRAKALQEVREEVFDIASGFSLKDKKPVKRRRKKTTKKSG